MKTILVALISTSVLFGLFVTGTACAQPKDVPGAGYDLRLDTCWAQSSERKALDACVAKPVFVCRWQSLTQGSGRVKVCAFR